MWLKDHEHNLHEKCLSPLMRFLFLDKLNGLEIHFRCRQSSKQTSRFNWVKRSCLSVVISRFRSILFVFFSRFIGCRHNYDWRQQKRMCRSYWLEQSSHVSEYRNKLKELRHHSRILKKLAKLFKIIISNLFQSSPSSAILVPFCSRITPLLFFFLSKPLILGIATIEL